MQSTATTVDQYIAALTEDRRAAVAQLRKVISAYIPEGFEECMGYGMAGYVVPHSKYPAGYHCDPKQPLPFLGFASQKNFIAVYHMGIYADPELLHWFTDEHAKVSTKKLDMGKSCIRFKKPEHIPYDLIGELMTKMSAEDWITLYETNLKR